MTQIQILWSTLVIIYGAFFGWYTSFEGPLTEEEIAEYIELFEQNEVSGSDLEVIRRFMEQDTGDDFAMVNVIHFYDRPLQGEGVEPGETSSQVLDKYMQYMYPALFSRASHPVYFGSAASPALDIMNAEGMDTWSSGALMRYRSRRDMLEISTNPSFAGSHEYKVAAMAKTIAFPVDPWIQLGDPRLVFALLLSLIGALVSWRLASRSNKG